MEAPRIPRGVPKTLTKEKHETWWKRRPCKRQCRFRWPIGWSGREHRRHRWHLRKIRHWPDRIQFGPAFLCQCKSAQSIWGTIKRCTPMQTFQIITRGGLTRNIEAESMTETTHTVEFVLENGQTVIFRKDLVLRIESCPDFGKLSA